MVDTNNSNLIGFQTVRLRLNLTRSLVEDPDLNVKVDTQLWLVESNKFWSLIGWQGSAAHKRSQRNNAEQETQGRETLKLTRCFKIFFSRFGVQIILTVRIQPSSVMTSPMIIMHLKHSAQTFPADIRCSDTRTSPWILTTTPRMCFSSLASHSTIASRSSWTVTPEQTLEVN